MKQDKKLTAILVVSISLAASLGMASAQTSDGNSGLKIPTAPVPDDGTEPTSDAGAQYKFDTGFYQKIQDLIQEETHRTDSQTSHQRTHDPDGPRGASDDQRHYNVIIVVGRNGANPDDAARQNKNAIVRHLEALGARDIAAAKSLSFVTASVPVSEIPGLSLREEIRQMGDGELPLTPQADTARQTIRATPSDLQRSVGWEPNGTGVVVAVIDLGQINSTHLNNKVADRAICDHTGCQEPRPPPSDSIYIIYAHGTRVSGVLAASGMRSNNGMAPGVTLLSVDLVSGSGIVHALDWSYNRGADVVNISLVTSGCHGALSTVNMIINEAIYRRLVVVAGAGNGGYLNGPNYQSLKTPGCSHNVIAVGGINAHYSPPIMYTFASRGPISDSEPRLVPHIVAPAVDIHRLKNFVNDETTLGSGTSLATPQVSATAAILLQANPELTQAGVRAALLLGANWTGPVPCTSAQYEQNNTNDPCSFAMQPTGYSTANSALSLKILNNVGFGILNVAESLRYANSAHIISDYLDAATRTRTYKLDVTDASGPVKIILTWMVPGQILTDLNLEIITPGGSTINASSVHQTTEFAVFNPSETGIYTIKVQRSGSGLSSGTVQTFALASTSSFPVLAIDAVDPQTVNVHNTMRLNVTTQNATGPVRYSIDPLEGAYIHPLSGHLVYVPAAGQQGLQNITVRASDSYNTDSATIRVAVGEPAATVTGIEARPDGAHVATVDVGPDNVTGMFATRTHADTTALSDPATSDAGTNAAQFTSDILGSDHPRDDTIYYFVVWSGSSPDPDDRIYARFAPGQNGSEKIIPNPLSRPAHYMQNISTAIQTGRSVTVEPELADNDGNPTRITAVTNGTEGWARTNGTAVTYTLNAVPDTTITDTITYMVTDNTGLQVSGTINITFEPFAIDIVDDRTVTVHSTLRIDIGAQNAKGPVTWSIDEKSGARIHPATGHLVYLPPPGSEGPQTLTVRADDGISSASANIGVNVTGPVGTITDLKLYTNNKFRLDGIYASNNPTPDALRFGGLSGDTFAGIGGAFNQADNIPQHFLSNEFPAPEPYTLYLLIIRPDTSGSNSADSNIFVRLVPGHTGFPIMPIPNPFTRPDPFAPDITVPAVPAGMPVPITPELVGMDGGPVNITAVTNGTHGTASHTNTTITYVPETGAGGADTITYTVTDDRGASSTAKTTIILPDVLPDAPNGTDPTGTNVTAGIDAPDEALEIDEDSGQSTVMPMISGHGGTATITAVGDARNGTTDYTDTTVTYEPDLNYHGPDMFTYTVTDGINATASGTVRITVRSVNDLPAISGLENMTISELIRLDIPVAVTDADNTTDQLTLTTEFMEKPGLPEGMQITKERLTWTPTESQGPGTYPFTVSIDDGLNQTTREFTFTVREANQNPEFNITRTDHTATRGIEFTLNMNASDADLPEQEITCSITSQDTGSVPAQINPQTCIITWTPADLGGHVIRVQAQDNLGGATPVAAININVGFNDMEVPQITLNNATQNPQIIELGDEYEERGATATDDDPRYDGTVTADASRVDTGKTGTYTVTYTAPADPAGKTPGPVTRNVTVQDTTKPVIALIGPSNQIVDYGGTYMEQNATVTDNDPGYTGTVSIDTPEIDSRIENATHTVTYSAPADDAGNVPDIKTRTLTIGLQSAAPNQNPVARDATLNITEDSGKSTVRPEIFDPDMSGTPVIISVGTPSKGEADFNATDNTITYRPGENEYGPDSFNYTIQDNRLGNATGTIHVSIEPVNDPPELQTIDDITLDELELRTITLNATDVDNATERLIWTHTGGPEGLDITGNLLAWEPAESQGPGDHPFVITVSDNIDTVSQQVTFTVNEVNQDPVLHQGDVTATRDVLRQFQINATDSDIPRQTLTYRFETGSIVPTGANMSDTGHFSWTPAEEHSGARHVIAITVDDGAGGRTAGSFAIRVDGVGDPPAPGNIIVPGGDNTVIAPASNTTIGRMLEAYMSRGLVVYAGGPQPGLAGSSGAGFLLAGIIINGTYADSAGPADWNVTDPDDITVFVREIGNVPPILSGIGDYTINAFDTLTFVVSATDYNDTVSYRLSGAPNGAEISRQGKFSWTPGSADEGGHAFAITAHDGQNATDTESVTITVLPAGTPNESPIAPDVAAAVSPNDRVIIIPAISDPDGDPTGITNAAGNARGAIVSSDNSIEYIAGPNPGAETITYTVADSRNASVTGTITITIR